MLSEKSKCERISPFIRSFEVSLFYVLLKSAYLRKRQVLSFRINVHVQKTTIGRCAISTKNELSVLKHPTILLLKREKKRMSTRQKLVMILQ